MNESSLSFKYFDFSPFSDVIKNVFAIINQTTQYSSNSHSKKNLACGGLGFAFFIHELGISFFFQICIFHS